MELRLNLVWDIADKTPEKPRLFIIMLQRRQRSERKRRTIREVEGAGEDKEGALEGKFTLTWMNSPLCLMHYVTSGHNVDSCRAVCKWPMLL